MFLELAAVVERLEACNGECPGAEIAARQELAHLLPQNEIGLLQNIGRVRRARHQGNNVRPQHRLVFRYLRDELALMFWAGMHHSHLDTFDLLAALAFFLIKMPNRSSRVLNDQSDLVIVNA